MVESSGNAGWLESSTGTIQTVISSIRNVAFLSNFMLWLRVIGFVDCVRCKSKKCWGLTRYHAYKEARCLIGGVDENIVSSLTCSQLLRKGPTS